MYIFVYTNLHYGFFGEDMDWSLVGPHEEPHVYPTIRDIVDFQWEELWKDDVKIYQLTEVPRHEYQQLIDQRLEMEGT